MEYLAYGVVALVIGLIAYAAYRSRQQKNSGGYTAPGRPPRTDDFR